MNCKGLTSSKVGGTATMGVGVGSGWAALGRVPEALSERRKVSMNTEPGSSGVTSTAMRWVRSRLMSGVVSSQLEAALL